MITSGSGTYINIYSFFKLYGRLSVQSPLVCIFRESLNGMDGNRVNDILNRG